MSRQVPHAEDTATGTPTVGLVPISAGPGLAPAWGAAGGGGGANGLVLLSEFTCVGGESSVRLPATGVLDPSDYAAILLLWQARQNGSGDFSSTVGLELQFNDDTASHYRNMDSAARSNGATNAEGTTTGFTSTPRFYAGRITPSGADAGAAASGRILLPEAGRATFWQPILSDSLNSYSTTVDTQAVWSYGHWMQQVAITSITAICRNGASGDVFAAGTHFAVYGINATSGDGIGAPTVCHVYRSTDKNILAGAFTAVDFDRERTDSAGLHDNVTNPSRITFATSGRYRAVATVTWHVSGGTEQYRAWLFLNGSILLAQADCNSSVVSDVGCTLSYEFDVTAGDYIELYVRHTAVTGIFLVGDDVGDGSGDRGTELSVTKVG
jgi:hypothetical protein